MIQLEREIRVPYTFFGLYGTEHCPRIDVIDNVCKSVMTIPSRYKIHNNLNQFQGIVGGKIRISD